MLLLFALFSSQEQPPDVNQTNKKLLLVPGCSRRFALPSRGQASDTLLALWRLQTFVYPLKTLHKNSWSLMMGICRHAFALKLGNLCKMSEIIGNARSQPLEAGYLGTECASPPPQIPDKCIICKFLSRGQCWQGKQYPSVPASYTKSNKGLNYCSMLHIIFIKMPYGALKLFPNSAVWSWGNSIGKAFWTPVGPIWNWN